MLRSFYKIIIIILYNFFFAKENFNHALAYKNYKEKFLKKSE